MSTAGFCMAASTASGITVGPGMERNSRPAETRIRNLAVLPLIQSGNSVLSSWGPVPVFRGRINGIEATTAADHLFRLLPGSRVVGGCGAPASVSAELTLGSDRGGGQAAWSGPLPFWKVRG